MLGIIVFLVALLAMFAWFAYLFAKDPANLFKRDERARRRRDFGRDVPDQGSIVTPLDTSRGVGDAQDGFTPGGGDFGGAGSSGAWSNDAGSDGGNGSSSDGSGSSD